jgi:Rieske 2Fe-2S family protein
MNRIPLEPTLPRGAYLDAADFDAECAKIFRREWCCAGRSAELVAPGDFRLHRLAGENVIVTRDRGGQLHAFYNVCRHRGTELVSAADPAAAAEIRSQGRFPGAIRCPYHGWTYELDGALRAAPWLDEKLGACKSQLSLHSVGRVLFSESGFSSPRRYAIVGRTTRAHPGAHRALLS